ncbi:VanZ family protein [Gaopeijia maritima]|uniref:VanZ family protein n=1 Tax=Gaopeijia maritima TaxID=3119007 RepID=A0ABU9E6C7_9BACT
MNIEAVGAALVLASFAVAALIVPWILSGLRDPGRHDQAQSRARERRLWLALAAVLLGIYATLSPVQRWAAALRDRGQLEVVTAGALLALVVVSAIAWLRTRPGRLETGVACGLGAVYVATVVRLPEPEARSHLFEYSVVAVLILLALRERRARGERAPAPALLAVLATAGLGWLDEGIQALLPNRVYDLRDVGFNALAGAMAVAATSLMSWARGRARRPR